MASILVALLLFFIPLASVEAKIEPSNLIRLGYFLSPITEGSTHPNSWRSASGCFAFGFYPEGNGFAVGIWIVGHPNNNNTVVWTANRDYPPVSSNSTVEFTTDGRLILNDTEKGTKLDIANFTTASRAVSASMLDSGNFVMYDNETSVIWESFSCPTDTILGTQTLFRGMELVSSVSSSSDHSSGRFLLQMQQDAHLVARPVNTSDYVAVSWRAAVTRTATDLILNFNGLLYLGYDNPSGILQTLANSSASSLAGYNATAIIFRATLDDDGILRLYSHRFVSNRSSNVSIEWSMLEHRCKVHGFCGLNSYCSSNGPEADCHCFPGFVPFKPSNHFLGCYRNFTKQRCGSEEGFGLVNITSLENSRWSNNAYSVVPMKKKEDCGKSCQEDCNCGAALYLSEQCSKHKLPLRYGTRDLTDSATAFFKISSVESVDAVSPSNPTIVTENRAHLISILAVSLGSFTLLCIVIAISSFFMYRHRVDKYEKLPDNAKFGLMNEEFSMRSFSYKELEEATQGFKEELGKGSFGTVYKGTLLSGGGGNKNIVAIKRLENVLEGDGDRDFHFQTEVTTIGRTHHRNLVRLLGFCVEGRKKLLVYEYMSNGSLADVLFKAADHERRPSWKERVKIALDIARGILYLHEECETCIIHCGIKPQNILMDDSWTAKISDFGLANLTRRSRGGGGGLTETADPKSSYLAPEWQPQQQERRQDLISVKADIYSFGVVLLEVICCRRNIVVNVSNADEMILSTWVYKCFVTGELYKLLLVGDERDEEMRVNLKTLERMAKVGLWCVQDDPGLRPSIKNVILMLEGIMNIPIPSHPSPDFPST